MYIESIPNRSSPPAILLRESYREGKVVSKRTIANLSKWPPHLIEGFKVLLQGKAITNIGDLSSKSGKAFGGSWVIKKLAEELLISKVLGKSKKAMLVMIMICGRILTQGSRRHLKFWKDGQAIEEIFGISDFDEDDLYEAMDWLEERQGDIEKRLFNLRYKGKIVKLFLYDITSSYLEGQYNELAEYGYNRDGKKGKKQIVYGLLTDEEGAPIAVEVFKGNTIDSTTVTDQIKKLARRFEVEEVIFVGDRGMVKKTGIESIDENKWHYITAITKVQIESLIKQDVLQLELFDEELVEVEDKGIRYILRRNPVRMEEIRKNRNERIFKIESYCEELNLKLTNKVRSREDVALKDLLNKITQLKLTKIFTVRVKDRRLSLEKNVVLLEELSLLDGCYVIKTNIKKEELNTEKVHSAYKNLSFVEWAFRTMKTGFLEVRPLYHRKANRTRACVLIAMFAYMILHNIFGKCRGLNIPLKALLEKLDQIQTQEIKIAEQWIKVLPTEFRDDQQDILDILKIKLPKTISSSVPSKS